MAVSRRNTLIGLGALVGGAGVFAATGAFTTVEAQREVSIEAAGDSAALLTLVPKTDATLVDDEGDVIEFDLEGDQLNLRARTTFELELRVTNNGDNNVDIDILSDFGGRSLINDNTVVNFVVNDNDGGESSETNLASGQSVDFDITIDFSDSNVDSLPDTAGDAYEGISDSPIDTVGEGNTLLDQDFGEGDGGYLVVEANEAT